MFPSTPIYSHSLPSISTTLPLNPTNSFQLLFKNYAKILFYHSLHLKDYEPAIFKELNQWLFENKERILETSQKLSIPSCCRFL